MIRLLIAIVVGAVVAVGAAVAVTGLLAGAANGAPTQGSLYQYGNR